MDKPHNIRVVSETGLHTTRVYDVERTKVYDAETGEDLTQKYHITDIELYLVDRVWFARIEFMNPDIDVQAEVEGEPEEILEED